MRIIPAIDLQDGRCVRLFQGDFQQQTEYSTNPLSIAERFATLDVADLHIVDLDGALSGRQANTRIIQRMTRETDLDIQVGGGIRSREAVQHWLDHGVRRCVFGSLAVQEPATIVDWSQEFGTDQIVVALDVVLKADGAPALATDGWTRTSDTVLWDAIEHFADAGIYNVLCTDISRDGALTGPNLDLYRETLERFPGLQLQASGGIRNLGDLEELRKLGLPAAITGRALLDGTINADEVMQFRLGA